MEKGKEKTKKNWESMQEYEINMLSNYLPPSIVAKFTLSLSFLIFRFLFLLKCFSL